MGSMNQDSEDSSGLVSQINMTPFVDIVLVLLVIFIVTAPALVKEIFEIRLPQVSTSDGAQTQTLGVAINRDGNILLEGVLVDEALFQTRLQEVLKMNPQAQAVLAADQDTSYGRVARVIDLMKSMGFERFAVQIEKQEKPAK